MIDPRERFNDPEETLRVLFESMARELWTSCVGIIESFNAELQTATVQPAIKAMVQGIDGKWTAQALPLLLDVPVYFPSGGGCSLTFPVATGDECLVCFADRCIDGWWQNGGVQLPITPRAHDLSDGMCFVGFRSKPEKINNLSTTATELRADDGLTKIALNPTAKTINILAPNGLFINDKRVDDTHTHSGVTTGSGSTGVVT